MFDSGAGTSGDGDRMRLPLSGLSRDWGRRRTPEALQVWCEVPAQSSAL